MLDFSKARVCVIGDYIIDEYWHCTSSRISPEAPVAVCDLQRTERRSGGAGNVERGVTALGAECNFNWPAWPDHIKRRIIVGRHQVARVDELPDPFEYAEAWYNHSNRIKLGIEWANVVVISDYGHMPERVITEAIRHADANDTYIIVDPKRNSGCYQGANLITPNAKEWEMLQHKTYGAIALVTKGAEGMEIIYPDEDKKSVVIPSEAQEVFDVTGAGDTVVAVLAAAIGSGMALVEAAKLANKAAAIACRHFGTHAVTLEELGE